MRRTRVIPVLLIQEGGLVKTTRFHKPIYIGDPINTIRLFNDMAVDEVIVLDIEASKKNIAPNLELIKEMASEAFMPFSYGGGVKTLHHVQQILQCGVEKVVINHHAYKDISFLRACVNAVGSQSVVAAIDYKKSLFGHYYQFDHVKRKLLSFRLIEIVRLIAEEGVGELFLNSVDRDGNRKGLDLEVAEKVSKLVCMPIIMCGGAGSLSHLRDVEKKGISAIAAGSLFVFKGQKKGVLVNYPSEEELSQYLN